MKFILEEGFIQYIVNIFLLFLIFIKKAMQKEMVTIELFPLSELLCEKREISKAQSYSLCKFSYELPCLIPGAILPHIQTNDDKYNV